MSAAVLSLYRHYLREIRALPHLYLRLFFRIKSADDFRAVLATPDDGLRRRKIKRVSKDLRKIAAANAHDRHGFAHVLDLAYGRKGKLKSELLQPLLSDPNAPLPPRIIPAEEKSRPPVYSPELKALLTSPQARSKRKALSAAALVTPPTLPARADPLSEDARLLGRLSKRREVNIRWRFFTEQQKKLLPPLQVGVHLRGSDKLLGSDPKVLARAGIRALPMQNSGILEEAERLAGVPWKPRPLPKRARGIIAEQVASNTSEELVPTRWLRRRYQELLGRLPVLTYDGQQSPNGKISAKYTVSLPSNAIIPTQRLSVSKQAVADSVDVAWLQHAGWEGKGQQQK